MSTLYHDLYCKVYIQSGFGIDDLYQRITRIVVGKQEPIRSIKTGWGEIDLRQNDGYNEKQVKDDEENFVYWKYYLDIEPNQEVIESEYIDQIASFLSRLDEKGIKAVASCDFEDRLQHMS